jgi:hypothetical protein
MIQELGRLRLMLNFGTTADQYPQIRGILREKAWSIARAAMSKTLYCTFATFPGWKSAEGLMDYEPMWERFPVTDFRTLCLTVQHSPIDDDIGDSILRLLPESLMKETRERLRYATPSENDTWLRQQLEKTCASSPLPSFIAECFADRDLSRGLLMYGDVTADTSVVLVERGEAQLRFMMHLTANSEEPLLIISK